MDNIERFVELINQGLELLKEYKHFSATLLDFYIDTETPETTYAGKTYIAKIKYYNSLIGNITRELKFKDFQLKNPESVPCTGHNQYMNNKDIEKLPTEKRLLVAITWYIYFKGININY